MGASLLNYEWQFLLQMVTRIYTCQSYSEVCRTLNRQIPTLIPCTEMVFFRIRREKGRAVAERAIAYDSAGELLNCMPFLKGDYPNWAEFIMAANSTVFRQSDLISGVRWERSRVYKDIWEKQNIYWGLMLCLVRQDVPLCLLGLFRPREADDFTEREQYVLQQLVSPLEMKYHELLFGVQKGVADHFAETVLQYQLTRRESEILEKLLKGNARDVICGELCITPATLSKHITSIYAKLNVHNRVQLMTLFRD